ncbi:hypothetical protein DFH06DRAFT_1131248 [Mycena polygramma]|nr:hypothetical protein DFH06DRAFT_1131248 [Mycena polygramma]
MSPKNATTRQQRNVGAKTHNADQIRMLRALDRSSEWEIIFTAAIPPPQHPIHHTPVNFQLQDITATWNRSRSGPGVADEIHALCRCRQVDSLRPKKKMKGLGIVRRNRSQQGLTLAGSQITNREEKVGAGKGNCEVINRGFAQQPYEPSDGFFDVRTIWLMAL